MTTNWDPNPGNDQFAQAEAAGFNPYASPDGAYEQPPSGAPWRPSSNRFGQSAPVRFWDLDAAGREAFKRAAADQEGVADFEDLPVETRERYYGATWTPEG